MSSRKLLRVVNNVHSIDDHEEGEKLELPTGRTTTLNHLAKKIDRKKDDSSCCTQGEVIGELKFSHIVGFGVWVSA